MGATGPIPRTDRDAADGDPGRPAPLFLLCPIRSFSSIVCAMLGQHPEMYSFPELRLFNAETVGGVLRYHEAIIAGAESSDLPARDPILAHHVRFFRLHEQGAEPPRFSDGLLRALAELHCGGQTAEGVARADAWLRDRLDWPIRRVYDLLLDRVAPRVGVDKSPHTSMSPPALERVLRLYPGARFLHLTRHPIATIRSMHQFFREPFRRSRPDGDPRDLARHCARVWHATHRAILDFTRGLPRGQVLRVRGEDLLEAPRDRLAAVARWLGVAAEAEAIEAMEHPERSPFAGPGPEGARFGNDPKFLADPQPRRAPAPRSHEVPAEWELPAELRRGIAELAGELGYTDAGEAGDRAMMAPEAPPSGPRLPAPGPLEPLS